MYTLNHQNVVLTEPGHFSAVFPLPGLEIKRGKLHTLSFQKRCHVFVKLFHIQSLQALIIRLTILIQRRPVMIHIIIVKPDGMRLKTVGSKLDGKPVGKGRLAGGGRPCNHNELHALASCDVSGNLTDPPLL